MKIRQDIDALIDARRTLLKRGRLTRSQVEKFGEISPETIDHKLAELWALLRPVERNVWQSKREYLNHDRISVFLHYLSIDGNADTLDTWLIGGVADARPVLSEIRKWQHIEAELRELLDQANPDMIVNPELQFALATPWLPHSKKLIEDYRKNYGAYISGKIRGPLHLLSQINDLIARALAYRGPSNLERPHREERLGSMLRQRLTELRDVLTDLRKAGAVTGPTP